MGFFDWFRSDPKKENVQKAAKAYKRIMDFTKNDKTKLVDKKQQSSKFLDDYMGIIDEYVKSTGYKQGESQEIDNLLKAFFERYPDKKPVPPLERQDAQSDLAVKPDHAPLERQNAQSNLAVKPDHPPLERQNAQSNLAVDTNPDEERDNLNKQLGAVLDETDMNELNEVNEGDKKDLSKGIKPSAMKGLKDISCWMLRNSAKTGAYSGNDQIRHVTTGILNEDARVKLFTYYLVEHDMEAESNIDVLKAALAMSQTDYKPNLEAFKSKVIASKFKFWKRINASHFNWKKIFSGIRLALKNKSLIKPFGAMSGSEVHSGDQKEEKDDDQANGKAPGNDKAKEGGDQNGGGNSPEAEKLKKAADEREKALGEYVEAGNKIFQMRKELSKKKKLSEEAKKKQLEAPVKALEDAFKKLKQLDSNVLDIYNTIIGSDIQDAPEKDDSNRAEKIGKFTDGANDIYNDAQKPSNVMKHYNNLANAANGIKPSWNIGIIPDEAADYMKNLAQGADVLSAASSVLSSYSLVLKLVRIYQDRSTMTAGTLAMEGMDAFSSAFSIASSLTSTIQSMLNVTKAIADTTSGVMGEVAGVISVYSGLATLTAMDDQKDNLNDAKKQLRDDAKAQKIIGVGERTTDIRHTKAAVKVFTGTLEYVGGVLTATGVSAVAGAAIGTVGTIIELTSDAVAYFRNRKNMADTVDDYINMNKMMSIIKSNSSNAGDQDMEEIKSQLREEMVGRLHYSSIEDLYDGIIDEYADYIYNHIFFKKGNKKERLKGVVSENEGYITLLRGFGAKPDFSKNSPSIKTIAEYLKKV